MFSVSQPKRPPRGHPEASQGANGSAKFGRVCRTAEPRARLGTERRYQRFAYTAGTAFRQRLLGSAGGEQRPSAGYRSRVRAVGYTTLLPEGETENGPEPRDDRVSPSLSGATCLRVPRKRSDANFRAVNRPRPLRRRPAGPPAAGAGLPSRNGEGEGGEFRRG